MDSGSPDLSIRGQASYYSARNDERLEPGTRNSEHGTRVKRAYEI